MPPTEMPSAQAPEDVMTHFITTAPQTTPQPTPSGVVIPALFPNTMFPVISQPTPPMKKEEPKGEKREERDELVEAIAALAILRVLTQGT